MTIFFSLLKTEEYFHLPGNSEMRPQREDEAGDRRRRQGRNENKSRRSPRTSQRTRITNYLQTKKHRNKIKKTEQQ